MRPFWISSLLLSVLLLIVPHQVLGCSCAEKQNQLKEFESSELVFKGRIISIEAGKPQTETDPTGQPGSITVVVEKIYKGDLKIGQRLSLRRGSGIDCNYTFGNRDRGATLDPGISFLIYLRKPFPEIVYDSTGEPKESGNLINGVSFCSRSGDVSTAAHDLAYLDNLEKLKGKNRLSGRLIQFYGSSPPDISDMRIKVIGNGKTYVTKIVESNYFEFYDIPNGEYVVEFETPEGWKLSKRNYTSQFTEHPGRYRTDGLGKNQERVFISDGHYGLDFALDRDTLVSGRLLSREGKPVENICVSAAKTNAGIENGSGRACSDKDGLFSFDAIPVGSYHLVVNREGKISSKHPFGRVFYPGVSERSKAGVVNVSPGRYITGADIQIPEMARLIEISGNFTFDDGRPVERGTIVFTPSDTDKFDQIDASSDGNGKFVIRIPFGAAGTLTGKQLFWDNVFSCPQIVAARQAAATHYLQTQPLPITGFEPLTNATLKFPFDFCEREDRK
jgi:hypothetical protein